MVCDGFDELFETPTSIVVVCYGWMQPMMVAGSLDLCCLWFAMVLIVVTVVASMFLAIVCSVISGDSIGFCSHIYDWNTLVARSIVDGYMDLAMMSLMILLKFDEHLAMAARLVDGGF
ncbi:hypothetical protein QVD17_40149 [Tagetes erecta]|uniref:Uncharacterized protein n=1 Tax=Tagetes erecta TaxID=13708 RepID=A0AAD8NGT7_TARER|nr:hypothetical protein QVD17_40149 [Tagetes erecta]